MDIMQCINEFLDGGLYNKQKKFIKTTEQWQSISTKLQLHKHTSLQKLLNISA